jgi:multidrug efflux pump
MLRLTLNYKGATLVFLLALLVVGALCYQSLAQEFIPKEDIGYFTGDVIPPPSSSIDYVNQQMLKVNQLYAANQAIAYYATFVLAGGPTSFVSLKDWGQRKQSLFQVVDELEKKSSSIPGIDLSFNIPDPVNISSDNDNNDYTLQLMSTGDYQSLSTLSQQVAKKLKESGILQGVKQQLKFDVMRYNVSFNRELISQLNIDPQDIATTLSTMVSGEHNTDLELDGQTYRVILQLERSALTDFSALGMIYVEGQEKQYSPLSSLITLTPKVGQGALMHYNHMRSAMITAQLKSGKSIGDAINYTKKVVPPLLHPEQHYSFSGKAADFLSASSNMAQLFILSIVFIYLILAAQFESFIDPFIILLTVPMAMVFALICLKISGGTLNTYSEIGLVTLIGLISKHGILITQFANNLREQGHSISDAIVQSSTTRLRPILMTTFAMVLGSLPLVLAFGAGSISHRQIGIIIVSGLIFGTFFSLFVVPIAYSYLGQWKKISPENKQNCSRNTI